MYKGGTSRRRGPTTQPQPPAGSPVPPGPGGGFSKFTESVALPGRSEVSHRPSTYWGMEHLSVRV